jgi:hypothetical protein
VGNPDYRGREIRAWRNNGVMMEDHHNLHWHSIADDRPDSNGWDWPWYSDLTDGNHSTWGMRTVKKFENINVAAKNDHPGILRRIGNWFIDG